MSVTKIDERTYGLKTVELAPMEDERDALLQVAAGEAACYRYGDSGPDQPTDMIFVVAAGNKSSVFHHTKEIGGHLIELQGMVSPAEATERANALTDLLARQAS